MSLMGLLPFLTAKSCNDCLMLIMKIKSKIHLFAVAYYELELNDTIEHFSLQIQHEQFVFSANGILSVNYKHLTYLLSLITSFFMIFIQYKPTESM